MKGWTTVELGEVASVDRDGVDAWDIKAGTLYVGLENVRSGGDLVNVAPVDGGTLASSKFRFTNEHVLFGKLRPYLAKVARPDFDGICSTDILPIRPGPTLDRGFLAHFLLRPESVAWAAARSNGANLPRLSPTVLMQMDVPLPPLDEQRRIASLLDRVRASRAKRGVALSMLDTLEQSIFVEMFATEEGAVELISDLAQPGPGSIRTGPFGSQLLHSEFVEEGIAVLGIDNVVSNEFRWAGRRFITQQKHNQLKRYTVRPRDVLITIMGTNGRCAIVPDNIGTAINTKHLCCITLDQQRCLPQYLRAYFLFHAQARNYLERTAKGAIMSGLNMEIIKRMPVMVPRLERQQEFAMRLAKVESAKESSRAALSLMDALYVSLQSAAFGGS